MTEIADEKYVRLTTFTKDGSRKESPVWIADLGDGTVGFTTGANSWKVKRINNTPTVELRASNMKGEPKDGTDSVFGTAKVVSGSAFSPVENAIAEKYGFQVTAMKAVSKVGKLFGKGEAANCGVVVTLD